MACIYSWAVLNSKQDIGIVVACACPGYTYGHMYEYVFIFHTCTLIGPIEKMTDGLILVTD